MIGAALLVISAAAYFMTLGRSRTCIECGTTLNDHAKICPACQLKLDPTPNGGDRERDKPDRSPRGDHPSV